CRRAWCLADRRRANSSRAAARPGRLNARADVQPIEAIEKRQRLLRGSAAVDRRPEQAPGLLAIAAIEGCHAGVQQLFGLTLPLGERAARPLDVRTRASVAPVEKQRSRPDVDGLLVVRGKIVVKAGQQQLFDLAVAISFRGLLKRPSAVGAKRIGHMLGCENRAEL